MRAVSVLFACCLAVPAAAATLKPFATVSGSVVRLSDLWDGVEIDKALGPAPAPGGRITVAAPQLAAIARQYRVDWRPGASGDRAILERSSRALTRDDIKTPLRDALTEAGAHADADLEVGAFTAPPLPADAKLDVSVEQLEFDKVSGRFAATLQLAAEGNANAQVRVTGRVQDMVDVPVAQRRLLPGEVIGPRDLQWARVRAGLARGDLVRTPAQAIGQVPKHSLAPNQPIPTADLGRPTMVQKGTAMTLSLETPGLQLTAQGVATEPGGIGEHIRVLNAFSRTTVEAEITGPGQARVVPGTARPALNLNLGLAAASR